MDCLDGFFAAGMRKFAVFQDDLGFVFGSFDFFDADTGQNGNVFQFGYDFINSFADIVV